MGRFIVVVRTFALVLFMAGCSTFETRITEYPELYATLDPETQANLRNRVVQLGYTTEMAYIAFGQPDEVRRIVRADGESMVWLYQYSYPVYDGFGYVAFHHHFVHTPHGVRLVHFPTFRERYRYETRDYLRLEFVEGRITVIERIDAQ